MFHTPVAHTKHFIGLLLRTRTMICSYVKASTYVQVHASTCNLSVMHSLQLAYPMPMNHSAQQTLSIKSPRS